MPLVGNDPRLKMLNDVIAKQHSIDKRVERLETLEFEKVAKSNGCISWLDYEWKGLAATYTVDVPANPFELGDYGWTQLTIWYSLAGYEEGGTQLHMTFNAIAANYAYNYKYTKGVGPQVSVGAEGQASFIIANLYYNKNTTGWVQIPFYPVPVGMNTFGDWEAYDDSQGAGSKEERGEFGGRITSGAGRVSSINFFAGAGNIAGLVYLYGWCPTWDAGTGPPD